MAENNNNNTTAATVSSKDVTLKVAYGILEFLHDQIKEEGISANKLESLEVAIQCIESGYGISLKDEQFKGKKSLGELVSCDNPEEDKKEDGLSTGLPSPAATETYASNANDIFSEASIICTGDTYEKPEGEATEDEKRAGDELKDQGNEAMKAGQVDKALELYGKAIEVDGRNPIYFCNRAAAYLKLEDFEKARRDCQIAAQLQPTYAKAYGRLGLTYSSENNHIDAIICYRKAVALDPENEGYRNNLQISQRLMVQDLPQTPAQATVSPNLTNFFNNPRVAAIASQLINDPAIIQRMESALSSPGMAGSGMDYILQMGQAIAEQLQNPNSTGDSNPTGGGTPPNS